MTEWVDNVYVLHKNQMIGDTQVITIRGYDSTHTMFKLDCE